METLLLALALAALYIAFLALLELSRRKFGVSAEITRRIAHIGTGLCTLLNFSLLPSPWFLLTRKTYGELFLPLGTLISFVICSGNKEIFVPSILVLTFADSFAGLVSNFYKQPRKMFRGSLVFFAVSLVVLLSTSSADIWLALLISAALTLVERVSPLGSDNLTVPAAAALFLLLL